MIRVIHQQELPQVIALAKRADPYAWSSEQLALEFESPHGQRLGFYQNDVLCAYVLFSVVVDEVNILYVITDLHCRRQKMSLLLIQEILNQARAQGCEKAWLELRSSNEAAYRLYSCMGFVNIFLRKSYYKNPEEDAIVMSKTLSLV